MSIGIWGRRCERPHTTWIGRMSSLSGAMLLLACLFLPLEAQQWRGRASTRVQYVEARPLDLDSVSIGLTTGSAQVRAYGDTLVTCAAGEVYCYFYRPAAVKSTGPVTQDLELTAWGLGIEGLRIYVNTRLRAALGDEAFWPRSDDHIDLLAGYVELNRQWYRVRVGRDYQLSGLGYYGYDGGSAQLRLRPLQLEVEAYGGLGLARGLSDAVTSSVLASLEEFQPRNRNYIYGWRASARPIPGAALEAIYQREVESEARAVVTERVGLEATLFTQRGISFRGHADYDLATDDWGKMGATVGVRPSRLLYVEGRVIRYRPVFSLQTIWAVFSPTPYTGWGVMLGLQPADGISLRVEGERRQYEDTDAEVPFQATTDRTWRAGAAASWYRGRYGVEAGYWLNFSFGSALSAGEARVRYAPQERLNLGLKFSAFRQLEEFRVVEGRVWGIGADARWETDLGTFWGSIDRYAHNPRGDGIGRLDWNQIRASFGMAIYVGSEPGRIR